LLRPSKYSPVNVNKLYILYCNITQPVFTIELSSLSAPNQKKPSILKTAKNPRGFPSKTGFIISWAINLNAEKGFAFQAHSNPKGIAKNISFSQPLCE
jgi:hypothetical protein